MTIQEAKEILSQHRYRERGEVDAQLAEALAMAQRDDELRSWYTSEQEFHTAVSEKLRSIKTPPHLKAAILAQAQPKLIRPARWSGFTGRSWWLSPGWAAAAAVVLLAVG